MKATKPVNRNNFNIEPDKRPIKDNSQPVDDKTVDFKLNQLKTLIEELDKLNSTVKLKIESILHPEYGATEIKEKDNIPVYAPLVQQIQEMIDVVKHMNINQEDTINRIKL